LSFLWLRIGDTKTRADKSHDNVVAPDLNVEAFVHQQKNLPPFLGGRRQSRTE